MDIIINETVPGNMMYSYVLKACTINPNYYPLERLEIDPRNEIELMEFRRACSLSLEDQIAMGLNHESMHEIISNFLSYDVSNAYDEIKARIGIEFEEIFV